MDGGAASVVISCVFFFFQAEDGIRDVAVTGVQTCALPISTTATDDVSGEVVATAEAWRTLDRERVAAVLAELRGARLQRPPAYSAVKVAGERAYRRARRGEAVDLAPRPVEVRELELTRFEPPDAGFRATVSAGTYLRSLAREAGAALGCGAHLAALVRTGVGPFRLEDAVGPEAVTPADLRDPAALVADLPRRELDEAGRAAGSHGRPLPAGDPKGLPEGRGEGGRVALFARGELGAGAELGGGGVEPRAGGAGWGRG